MTENSGKLKKGLKLGYGFGTIGESIAYNTFYLYFIYFLTDFAGISPAVAGTISLVAVLWDAITDPLIGYLSDSSKNPKGRRRPFILRFAIPLSIMVFVIFTDFAFITGTAKVVYFFIANILFWFFFTAADIPYISLGAELTDDYNERTSIRTYATIFNYIGMIAASAGTITLVDKIGTAVGDAGKGWSYTALIFGALTFLAFFVAWRATRGHEKKVETERTKVNMSFIKAYVDSFKIKPYRKILMYTLFFNAGMMLMSSAMIYLMSYIAVLDEAQIATVFLVYSLMVIGASFLINALHGKIEKKWMVVIITAITAVGVLLFRVFDLNHISIYIYAFFVALGNAAYFILIWSMNFDVCEIDEFKTGERREGVIMAFMSFFLKFATAIGMALTGFILDAFGYNAEVLEQSERALNGIRDAGTTIPAILIAVSFIFALTYPVTKDKFEALKKALELKRAGKEYSTDGFEDIL
ncbi:MAG TPA: hypothetical protein DCO79_04925 [Spirochaeta sp.]|nr:hypothetical protein [Spirochaeta sp.]